MKSKFPDEIVFRRTSNVFLNTGIVSLYDYLLDIAFNPSKIEAELTEDALTIRGDQCLEVLEDVYYKMGKEVYDTANPKQIEEKLNAFYIEAEDRFVRFPRMNTLGLTELFTNNSQGLTRLEENKTRIGILRNTRPEIASKIEEFFKENKLDLLSNVYLNEPYTKITRLEKPIIDYFVAGDNVCYLTGEGYKKLVANTSTSPFLSGLANFNSFLSSSDKKISWKAMFVSRFSPRYCFYRYNSLDTIFCYLFETDNLLNLRTLLDKNRTIFMDKVQLLEANYMTNFKFYNFNSKKGDEQRTSPNNGFSEPHETRFMLIYTVYRNFLFSNSLESASELDMDVFDAAFGSKHIPISLVSFKADKFSGTLRPNYFEQFNHFKFTIRLMAHLEQKGINIQSLLLSLLFKNRSDRSSKNSFRLERQLRNRVLDKIMKAQSILPDLENLFFKCFLYLTSPDAEDRNEASKKNFKVLFNLVNLYEPILYRKMEQETLKSLQTRAVNLGYAIGNAILEYPDGTPQNNAKQARRYLIHLHKSRNAADFREALIRIMKKYMNGIANDLLYAEEMNDDQQFVFIKQFVVMAALNKINPVLKPSSSQT